jgi:hypothetical protein
VIAPVIVIVSIIGMTLGLMLAIFAIPFELSQKQEANEQGKRNAKSYSADLVAADLDEYCLPVNLYGV